MEKKQHKHGRLNPANNPYSYRGFIQECNYRPLYHSVSGLIYAFRKQSISTVSDTIYISIFRMPQAIVRILLNQSNYLYTIIAQALLLIYKFMTDSMLVQMGPATARFILFATSTSSGDREAPFRLQKDLAQFPASSPQAHPSIISEHPSKPARKSPLIFYIRKYHEDIYYLIMHIVLTYWSWRQHFPYIGQLSQQIKDINYRIESIRDAFKTGVFQEERIHGTYLEVKELFSNIKIYEHQESRGYKFMEDDIKFKDSFQNKVIEPYRDHLLRLRKNYDQQEQYEKQGQLRRGKIGLQLFQDKQEDKADMPLLAQRQQSSSMGSEAPEAQIQYVDLEEEDGDSEDSNELQGIHAQMEEKGKQEARLRQSMSTAMQMTRQRKGWQIIRADSEFGASLS